MCRPIPGLVVIVEDLVIVRVKEDVLIVRSSHIVLEGSQWLKAIVHDECKTRLALRPSLGPGVPRRSIRIVPVLPCGAEEIVGKVSSRLVKQADHRHHLPV